MALFTKKTKEDKSQPSQGVASKNPGAQIKGVSGDLAHVLRHARITEKATMHQEQSVYLFDVDENATKRDIIAAVRKLYQVTPRKVRTTAVPSKMKRSMRTGKIGKKTGGKKAYIYLKKGETINI